MGAGNDTVNATVATMGSLDVVDAGAGNDTLSIVETGSVTSFGGATFTGFETLNVSTSGAVGALTVAAGSTTAATAQVATVTVTAASSGQKYDVTIGGTKYVSAAAASTNIAGAADAIRNVLTAHLGDSITLGTTDTTAGTFTITSKIAGVPLPSLTYAVSTTTSTATGTVSSAATTANVTATAPVAVAETRQITLSTDPTAGDVFTLSVNGADYTVASSGATITTAAADVAALLNSVLGAGSATSTSGVVTVKALTAGTALPALNLTSAGSTTDTFASVIANKALNASAVTAASLSAPTGVTAFTATGADVVNVTAATTAALTASGTAVKTSGGNTVVITATDSVHSTGAVGAVTIKAAATTKSMSGAVAADTSTGSATDAAGIYVTGGTSVTITGTKDTGAIKIGAAPYAKAAVSDSGYPQSNGNSSKTPTGDVSITNVTKTASTTTGASIGTYGTGTATVYTNGATTVTVKGAGTTVITDANTLALTSSSTATAASGTSKLTTVNLAGLSGNATITSDAISSISVSDVLSAKTVTVANSGTTGANTGAINLAVSNVGTSSTRVTLDDATATSVNVSSAAASAYATVGSTTSNASSKSYITLTTPKATSVNMTNTLSVDIGDLTAAGMAKVAKVDASGATGAVTATVGDTSEQGLAFTSGAGNDSVTIKSGASLSANATTAAITSINLGAGNDKLLNGSTSSHTVVGATFNGGDGVDTLAASLLTLGNAAQFVGFETLGLDLTSGSMDTELMTGATSLSLLAQGGTYTNVKAAQGLSIAADVTAGTNTLTFASAVTSATAVADSYTVTMGYADTTTAVTASANEVDGGVVVMTGIEAVNVVSGGSGNITNSLNLTDTSARSLVITGAVNLNLDFGATDSDDNTTTLYFGTSSASSTDGLGVTSIDATAMTGKLDIDTTDVALSATGSLTVNTGSADDTITLATKSVVNAGAGNDTIILAVGNTSSTLTGGAGNDTFDVTAAVCGSGTSAETAPKFTTITDFAAGDTLKIAASSAGSNAYIDGTTLVAAAVSVADALDLALKGSTVVTDAVVWFSYAGNTYIAREIGTNGLTADDIVVKLTGIHTLSAAAVTTPTTGLFGEA